MIEPIKCLHWAEGTKERICADKINELIALTPKDSTYEELISILSAYCGESGNNEGAVDTLLRLEDELMKHRRNLASHTAIVAGLKEEIATLSNSAQFRRCEEQQKEIAELKEKIAYHRDMLITANCEGSKIINRKDAYILEQQKEIASLQADLMSFDPATYPEAVKILQARDVEQQKRIEDLEAEVVGCKKICKISAESEFRLLTDRDRYKKALEEIKNIGT